MESVPSSCHEAARPWRPLTRIGPGPLGQAGRCRPDPCSRYAASAAVTSSPSASGGASSGTVSWRGICSTGASGSISPVDVAVHQVLAHGGSVWAVRSPDLGPAEGIAALLRY